MWNLSLISLIFLLIRQELSGNQAPRLLIGLDANSYEHPKVTICIKIDEKLFKTMDFSLKMVDFALKMII